MTKIVYLYIVIFYFITHTQMDKSLRNTFIGSIIAVIVTFIGAWIQLNSRISVLEIQVSNDHQAIINTNRNIDDVKKMQTEILIGIQHLQDVKKDK